MSVRPYAEMAESGLSWAPLVPAHWRVCEIKRVAALQSGDAITSDRITEAGEHPVFGGGGQRGYTDAFTHEGHFALIGRQGALCGNVNYGTGKFWASEHAVVATPRVPLDTMWLGETLRAMNLNQYSVSAAQPGLSVDAVSRLRLPVPPVDEQRAIAAFLDRETAKIDALVAEQERLMALLREKRQAVISHAVTKGLNPNVQMKATGVEWLGEVPSHWRVERIANVFREVADHGEDSLPILSVSIHSGVTDDELDEEELDRKVTRSDDRTKYKQVLPGDLVYNMMRAWQGGFGTVAVHGMVSPAYVVARPRSAIRTEFVELLLRTPQAVEQMRRHSRGVTDFRLRLYWDEFRNIRLPIPPHDEVDAICDRIGELSATFAAMTSACEDAIAILHQRRTALITAAVTGQIDVRNSENMRGEEAHDT